jgi:hypothetical protein
MTQGVPTILPSWGWPVYSVAAALFAVLVLPHWWFWSPAFVTMGYLLWVADTTPVLARPRTMAEGGERGNWLICDDPHAMVEVTPEAVAANRAAVEKWFMEALPGINANNVTTFPPYRVHEDDIAVKGKEHPPEGEYENVLCPNGYCYEATVRIEDAKPIPVCSGPCECLLITQVDPGLQTS